MISHFNIVIKFIVQVPVLQYLYYLAQIGLVRVNSIKISGFIN